MISARDAASHGHEFFGLKLRSRAAGESFKCFREVLQGGTIFGSSSK